jgi:hypothetical protein
VTIRQVRLRAGHPILDQFVQVKTDNPQHLSSLVENPTFCEGVLELVQGLGGEVEMGLMVVTQDELLLEPSVLWQRMRKIAESLALS